MGIFDIFRASGYGGSGAINAIPTPNPPSSVNYTRQSPAGGFDPFAGAHSTGSVTQPQVLGTQSYDYSQARSINPNLPAGGQPSGGQPSGDGSYGFNMGDFPNYTGWDPNAARQDWLAKGSPAPGGSSGGDPYASLRNEIGSGWDTYINSLNSQLGGLDTQRAGQEQIANAGYQQGINTLGLQKEQGVTALGNERQSLEQNQVRTLRDLVENQRQAFQAGNNFLGTRGASDSSAANQYSFALAKEAGRQRGDIMTNTSNQLQEVNQRETNLSNIYNTEVNNLEQTKNSQFGQIAQWFGDAQNNIKQMQASGQLNKNQDLVSLSKDILNQAIAEMNRINTDISGRRSALENWAMTNSKNISELKTNMQQAGQFSAQLPKYQEIAGTPQVDASNNMRTAFSYGGLTEEEKRRRSLTGQMR